MVAHTLHRTVNSFYSSRPLCRTMLIGCHQSIDIHSETHHHKAEDNSKEGYLMRLAQLLSFPGTALMEMKLS